MLKIFFSILFLFFASYICSVKSPAQQIPEPNQIVEQAWQGIKDTYFSPQFNLIKWEDLGKQIKEKKYSSVPEAYIGIQNLLVELNDPAVRFLTPQQTQFFFQEVTGAIHIGIGLAEMLSVDLNEKTGKITIVTPIPNTPAAKLGLKPNDVIVAIDGEKTDKMKLAEAVSKLRGAKDTFVKLTILRQGKNFDLKLKRETISPFTPAVFSELTEFQGKKIGYLAIYQFTQNSGNEAREAVADLIKKGAHTFVLDLRNNPGGAITAAQETSGIFLGQKPIALTVGKNGKTELVGIGEKLTDKPLAILINEGTASAAELVAVGLQSQKRAKIIGTKTFGKALIHGLTSLADGSALVVTISHLETLEGKKILGEGITPDVLQPMKESPILLPEKVKPASIKDLQFMRGISLRQF